MQNLAKESLSGRQAEIANLVAIGKSNREIAETLHLSPRTVEHHIEAIFNKLGVRSRVELTTFFLSEARSLRAGSRANPAKTNLPAQRTSLIGRESQIEAILSLFQLSRLVTLTGAGGVGKTRMALAVGEAHLEHAPEGVWLVDLAPLTQGSLAARTIARALSVKRSPTEPLIETLLVHLKPKSLLLILDNCEHVKAEASVLVDALLRGCPNVRILATSREPLCIAGEQTYRLPSPRLTIGLRFQNEKGKLLPDVVGAMRDTSSVRHARIVPRPALVDRLRQGAARIVNIVAPAGYGKTTLTAQFVSNQSAAICDCLDVSGIGDFARRLFAELAQYHPQRATAWAYEQIATVGNDDDALQLAISAWSLTGDPRVVVFENAESLARIPRLADIWRALLVANSRPIVICSRRAVDLPFGHGIGPQDVVVVGMTDLALSAAETRSLLGSASDEELERTMAITKGWPLAIGLIARMSDTQRLADVLHQVGRRESGALHDYLVSEFLGELSAETIETLICGAAIPHTTIAEISATLGRDCTKAIAALAATLPLTIAGDAVDIHPLLRAMLRERFSSRTREAVARAVAQAESSGNRARAAELYVALGDHRAAASTLLEVGPYLLSTPSLAVSGVLASLDATILAEFPMLWTASIIHRGYAMPPEEWLRTAKALWRGLDKTADATVTASVACSLLNGYYNIGKCADAEAFLREFDSGARSENQYDSLLVKFWRASLDSNAGRYDGLEAAAEELMPMFLTSTVTHALYLYDVLAPMYRARGDRVLEYRTLERAIEIGAGSFYAVFSIIYVGAAFGAWFAGEDDEFERYTADLQSRITPSTIRGHRFFLACARGQGLREKPGYEKMKVRSEGLLIASALASNLRDATTLARRAVEAADASERPFYRTITRLALGELDAEQRASLRNEALGIATTVQAAAFVEAVEAVALEFADHGILTAFIRRYARFLY